MRLKKHGDYRWKQLMAFCRGSKFKSGASNSLCGFVANELMCLGLSLLSGVMETAVTRCGGSHQFLRSVVKDVGISPVIGLLTSATVELFTA